ncbi:MAG: FG-GAP repeat protein [Phycisphaerales bacterium]|nr:MAG: FG-GAP repeat protein [Phycisphaerales bacterium]
MPRSTSGHHYPVLATAFAACLILAASPSARGQCLVNKLLASDGENYDLFGTAVAMSEQLILIGAPYHEHSDIESGAAYVFRLDEWNWVEDQVLVPSDADEDDLFGYSVAIGGNVAVVGAFKDDDHGDQSGSVYVFRNTGSEWMEQAKLLPVEVDAKDRFGRSVGVSIGAAGQVLVVGATGDDDNGEDAGAAYVFRFDGSRWQEEAKLLASDGIEYDLFGTSVAIEEDLIVVGARSGYSGDVETGSAYVFRHVDGEWVQEAKLRPQDGGDGDEFGYSVSLSGDVVVVGAPEHDNPGADGGAAYVYDYGGGILGQTGKLSAGDGVSGDRFGEDVDVSGDLIATGAVFDDNEVGSGAGAVYMFKLEGANWTEIAKLLPSEYADWDGPWCYGNSVALEGTLCLAGSPSADSARGAASIKVIGEPDCNWNNYCDGYDIARGVSTDCDENTVPDECEAFETSRLLASDGQHGDSFGCTVSISGPAAVIGAVWDDDNGSKTGSAYVYRYSGDAWSEEVKLTASDGEDGDLFGFPTVIEGELIAIGASGDDDNGENSGSVYVYHHDGMQWIEHVKLLPADGEPDDRFGRYVGMSGDVIIAGGIRDDDNGEDAGAAYIFRFDGAQWSEEAKLLASDGAAGDEFGFSIDICGDNAIIGARYHDGNGEDSGEAYIFTYDGSAWIEKARLVGPDAEAGDLFGYAVAIHDDLAVVGATGDDGAEPASGSARVFRYDGSDWTEEVRLFASDGAFDDRFGSAVAIDGETVVVGAYRDDDGGASFGSAYIYRYDGTDWVEMKIAAPYADKSDFFGNAVAIEGDRILIGAPRAGDLSLWLGAAYMFDGLIAADCNINGILDWCDIADGVSDDANDNGIPDECECPADLNADDEVNLDDLFVVLDHWGVCDDPANCPWDLAGPGAGPPDGKVNLDDLFAVLAAWGPCS